ncbi:gram domain-containing protein [Cyclospora cayetanensis]|uniref:Gram domain-containing protein n=1 Tax=Cyclospora cayetanensis TaxID=88456 RepID=A0A1D3D738_9EIME|nr:gram domain-containing protein [Cyclospora cayetanensis]
MLEKEELRAMRSEEASAVFTAKGFSKGGTTPSTPPCIEAEAKTTQKERQLNMSVVSACGFIFDGSYIAAGSPKFLSLIKRTGEEEIDDVAAVLLGSPCSFFVDFLLCVVGYALSFGRHLCLCLQVSRKLPVLREKDAKFLHPIRFWRKCSSNNSSSENALQRQHPTQQGSGELCLPPSQNISQTSFPSAAPPVPEEEANDSAAAEEAALRSSEHGLLSGRFCQVTRALKADIKLPDSSLTRILGLPSRGVLGERYTCSICTPHCVLLDVESRLSGMPYSDTFYLLQRLKCCALSSAAALRPSSCSSSKNATSEDTLDNNAAIQIDFEYEVVITTRSFFQGKIKSDSLRELALGLDLLKNHICEALGALISRSSSAAASLRVEPLRFVAESESEAAAGGGAEEVAAANLPLPSGGESSPEPFPFAVDYTQQPSGSIVSSGAATTVRLIAVAWRKLAGNLHQLAPSTLYECGWFVFSTPPAYLPRPRRSFVVGSEATA